MYLFPLVPRFIPLPNVQPIYLRHKNYILKFFPMFPCGNLNQDLFEKILKPTRQEHPNTSASGVDTINICVLGGL